MNNSELAVISPGELYRQATDVAGVCREIVINKAVEIQGRRYVPVEPWMAIAVAHGCVASIKSVERIEAEGDMFGGFKAVAELRRQSDGLVLATAEGFVGEDEPTWFGGEREVWNKQTRKNEKKTLPKRPDYAIRAMAQTRAISRVCRSAFAHVVVLIDAQLDTTPAEEIAHDDHPFETKTVTPAAAKEEKSNGEPTDNNNGNDWRDYTCAYGTKGGPLRGKQSGELTDKNLEFLYGKFVETMPDDKAKELSDADQKMREGLKLWKQAQG